MEITKKVFSTVIVIMLLCLSSLTAQAQTTTVKGSRLNPETFSPLPILE